MNTNEISIEELIRVAKYLDDTIDHNSRSFKNTVKYILDEINIQNDERTEINLEDNYFKNVITYFNNMFDVMPVKMYKDESGKVVLETDLSSYGEGDEDVIIEKAPTYEKLFKKAIVPSLKRLNSKVSIQLVHEFPELNIWMRQNNIKII